MLHPQQLHLPRHHALKRAVWAFVWATDVSSGQARYDYAFLPNHVVSMAWKASGVLGPDARRLITPHDATLVVVRGGLGLVPCLSADATLAVTLAPGAARAVFGCAVSALPHEETPLEDIVGRVEAQVLCQRLLLAADESTRLAVLEGWLCERLRRADAAALMPALVHLAERGATSLSAQELAARAGYSARHLRTLMAEELGLSPKALLRLLRFRATLHRALCPRPQPWSALAAEMGYVDQSHLIRDYQRFVGKSPQAFHQLLDERGAFILTEGIAVRRGAESQTTDLSNPGDHGAEDSGSSLTRARSHT